MSKMMISEEMKSVPVAPSPLRRLLCWEGYLLAVVTMVVLGGSGSMVGVIIAAFLMGLVTFGLSLLNVPGIVMSIIIGAMLIVVISLPIITRRMMQRRRI